MTNHLTDSIIPWIERFCGQTPKQCAYTDSVKGYACFPATGMGYSQLNELLLSLQLDRMSVGFFDYVFGTPVVADFMTFTECITKFRIAAIRKFGNVEFAFKRLSEMQREGIELEIARLDPNNARKTYVRRHDPLVSIQHIEPRDTFYLGYLIEYELREKRQKIAAAGGSTEQIDQEECKRAELLRRGEFNHHCYLDYDDMDVYVATSMRVKSDFWNVSRFITQVFERPELQELKLRYFDPTQAYCPHRIDKGLCEALMLKHAKCAIYMAGESDTLGKDSELAATLAQGKPVIAYVPRLSCYDRFKREIVEPLLNEVYVDENPAAVALDLLKTYAPQSAWDQPQVRDWINSKPEFEVVLCFLYKCLQCLYDKRAQTLLETHPLSLQVNLQTGVGNGVLVARDTNQCAKLIRGILLDELEFDLDEQASQGAVFLKEKETRSVYRVETRDQRLTNSFWNFYLK